jgi:hypothetical protein
MRILNKRRDSTTKEANLSLLLLLPRFRDGLVDHQDLDVKSGLAPLRPLSLKSSRRHARIDN